jgi:hypothetical protein
MTAKEMKEIDELYQKKIDDLGTSRENGEITEEFYTRAKQELEERRKQAVKPYWDEKRRAEQIKNNPKKEEEEKPNGCYTIFQAVLFIWIIISVIKRCSDSQ